ncbi:acyl-CoA dehydrogenase family protein [Streptomyces sp. SAI-127]|uniref:acyl-CoA dehydrogenase family protein n=1 Tax=Streptomyces sp. SAI-127 TaxID=2940543 RepID=UPI0024766B66|nr:acyl-CoA dehydrogenase family protein [Streptomyces sp. SAI-127]MDH6489343.1 two-component flavin-dependent monooxygenase [Streptomyces sp. SAI-127]
MSGAWQDAAALDSAAEAAGHGAADADTTGRLAPATVEALAAAGFPAGFAPAGQGGTGATFDEVTRAVAAIGEGCTSAAWIASLWAYNGRFSAHLPDEGQQEVWAKGPRTRLVSSMVAAGVEAEPVEGGWTLSGTWLYVSGVEFADWALVSSAPPREGDRSIRVFAVPRDSFTHQETWSTLGMRATGSHTLVVERAFVPEYRSFVWDDMRRGKLPGTGSAVHSAPLFAVNGLTFAAPILGAARGALRLVERHLAQQPSGARAAARESSRISYTRAAGEIDAAALLLARAAETADRGRLDEDGVAERSHRDSTLAVELLVGAVDRLFQVTGTRGQATSHPMQRIWRDVHAAGSHAALQFEPAAFAYTRRLVAA